MLEWFGWALMLIAQNACGTWTSRARNRTSLKAHGIASFFNNGVYFTNLFIGVDKIKEANTKEEIVFTIVFYGIFTMIGSVGSHHILMKYVERN